MQPIKVLFIDDDDSLQLLAAAMLDGRIFRVLTAKSTKEADRLLSQNRVDLIVCDVMMPEEDGLTFCSRLQQRGNKIPLMILSAVGDPKSVQQGIALGADQYLVKPFDIHELQRRMLAMVGRKPADYAAKKPTPQVRKFFNLFRQ